MGLFSSKYEYNAYVATSPLFEDKRPDTYVQNILEGALTGQMSFANTIRYSLGTDYFARAKAMMKYASKPPGEGYVRGFPSALKVRIRVPDEKIIEAIERQTGDTVTGIVSANYGGAFDEEFFIKYILQKYWVRKGDGNINDGILKWQPDQPPEVDIWCENFQTIQLPIRGDDGEYIKVPNRYEFRRGVEDPDLWDPTEPGLGGPTGPGGLPGRPLPPVVAIPPELNYLYTVTFEYPNENAEGGFADYPIGIRLDQFTEFLTLRVAYTRPGSTCPIYWSYNVNSGDDPELERFIDILEREAQFLPIAILMQDKVWFDEEPNSRLATSTNKLLKKLSMNGTKIKEGFLEQENDPDNPSNSAEKWDFFVHVAVPIRTNIRAAKEYLYHFFDDLVIFNTYDRDDYVRYVETGQGVPDPNNFDRNSQPVNELPIREGFENGYAVDYGWSYIEKKTTQGRDTQIIEGEEVDLKRREAVVEIVERNDDATFDRYLELIEFFHGPDQPIGNKTEDPENDGYHDIVYIKFQQQDEFGGWYLDHLLILGLSMVYKINTSDEVGYRFRYAVPELFGTEEETKEFRIPVSYKPLERVGVMRREDVITDGLCATVFLVEEIEIKWYQQSFFKWLIIIIAVVLIVLSIFFPPFLAAVKALGPLWSKLVLFAMSFVISFAGALIGGTFGQIFSLIGAIAMMGAGMAISSGTSWTSAWANMGSNAFNSFGSAVSFISSVSSIANSTLKVYQAYELEKLQADFENFLESAKEKQEALEAAWQGLGLSSGGGIDALSLSQTLSSVPAETPEEFYTRTINLNPGVLSYDMINNFASLANSLPNRPGDTNIVEDQYMTFMKQRGAV